VTILARYGARSLEGTLPLTSQALVDLFAMPVSAGVDVNARTALGVPAVRRAVGLISGIAAGLPLKAYRDNPDGTRVETTGQTTVLKAPYPFVTPFAFWRQVYADLLLWGNAYLFKSKNDLGAVVRLLRLPPWEVTVRQDEQTTLNPGGKWYQLTQASQRYGPYQVMHIADLGVDGLVGMSRIELGKESIGVAIAAERTAAKMFGDGLLFTGILSSDQDLTNDAAETLGARFRKMIRSTGPGAKIPVLGRGTKFEKVQATAEEGQFLEGRQFQAIEVGRLFDVDPALIMDPAAVMNYGEPQKQAFLDFTMDPWLRLVEQAVGDHLTPRGQFAEYNRGAFLRADTKTRYETHAIAVQFGLKTRNECRADENYRPLAGLDEPLTPVNLGGAVNEQPVPGETGTPGVLINEGDRTP
jgi:HK97 family phage portal protein